MEAFRNVYVLGGGYRRYAPDNNPPIQGNASAIFLAEFKWANTLFEPNNKNINSYSTSCR